MLSFKNAILAIAYFIVGFGLLNWLGSWKFAGGLVGWFSNTVRGDKYLDAVMTDSNGLRLTSIFQYANTYAAFLMAFLFVAVFLPWFAPKKVVRHADPQLHAGSDYCISAADLVPWGDLLCCR
ncbi:hypothetical protein ACFSQ7_05620 [Paenibacillus rhizoplanae]